jgi:protein SCO1/2
MSNKTQNAAQQQTPKRIAPGLLAGGIVLALIAAGMILVAVAEKRPNDAADSAADDTATYQGTVVDPPQELPDFTLTGVDGEPFSLSDLRGRFVLMAFGYTHCPDVCPLTLSEYKIIREALGDQADQVAFVFVSVDGERDTPERLAQYFDVRGVSDFVTGLTGPESDLRRIGVDYGLYFEKVKDPGTSENYLVTHTAASFLIDREGRLRMIFSMDPEKFTLYPEMVAERIKELL